MVDDSFIVCSSILCVVLSTLFIVCNRRNKKKDDSINSVWIIGASSGIGKGNENFKNE